ncbi:MAG: class II D-tagatose-bisphosphate aldolase non-catalytic subunit [Ruminiclostridium sp.]
MDREHPLKELVRQHKKGIPKGICSICSSHPYVIEAAIEKGVANGSYVLIEATANQVNQFGGYTGMRPKDFSCYVKGVAEEKGLPEGKLILGGDHLGPLVWKNENESAAMDKAEELIREYVKAGFSKIHIDTSMHLASDAKDQKLDTRIIAARAARLYEVAEKTFMEIENNVLFHNVYVIGSEVPVPGGTQEEEGIKVTEVSDLQDTLNCFREAFIHRGADAGLEKVIAVVVQPGVEFGEGSIHEYTRYDAKELTSYIKQEQNLIYEGHSTDYQRETHLKQMVEDGVAILKVGPALTFALREGLIALEHIEKIIFEGNSKVRLSNFSYELDNIMLNKPVYWEKYYHGQQNEIIIARKFSLSDRCRYYLGEKEVVEAIERLVKNLGAVDIPLTLLSEYLPCQYMKIREGTLGKSMESILKDKIKSVIDQYPQFQ